MFRINSAAGSAFDSWLRLGAEPDINAELVSYLNAVSIPAQTIHRFVLTGSSWDADLILDPCEVCLLELEPADSI